MISLSFFQPCIEYSFRYWDYIDTSRVTAIQHLAHYKFALEKHIYEIEMHRLEKLPSNSKKEKLKSLGAPPAPPIPSMEEHIILGHGQICRALFRVAVCASSLGFIHKDDIPFTSWELRFHQRFRMFNDVVSPPLLPYSDFDSMIQQNFEVQELLNAASMCFKKARSLLDDAKKIQISLSHEEFLQESVTSLLKVCVAGAVNNARISSDMKTLQRDGFKLSVECPYCPSLPVISIKSSGS